MTARTIMLIDEDLQFYGEVSQNLANYGFEVHQAELADASLDMAIGLAVELVIVAIDIPSQPGLVLCRKAKERLNCPIIIKTSSLDVDELAHLQTSLNSDDCIDQRTISAQEFLFKVDSLIGLKAKRMDSSPDLGFDFSTEELAHSKLNLETNDIAEFDIEELEIDEIDELDEDIEFLVVGPTNPVAGDAIESEIYATPNPRSQGEFDAETEAAFAVLGFDEEEESNIGTRNELGIPEAPPHSSSHTSGGIVQHITPPIEVPPRLDESLAISSFTEEGIPDNTVFDAMPSREETLDSDSSNFDDDFLDPYMHKTHALPMSELLAEKNTNRQDTSLKELSFQNTETGSIDIEAIGPIDDGYDDELEEYQYQKESEPNEEKSMLDPFWSLSRQETEGGLPQKIEHVVESNELEHLLQREKSKSTSLMAELQEAVQKQEELKVELQLNQEGLKNQRVQIETLEQDWKNKLDSVVMESQQKAEELKLHWLQKLAQLSDNNNCENKKLRASTETALEQSQSLWNKEKVQFIREHDKELLELKAAHEKALITRVSDLENSKSALEKSKKSLHDELIAKEKVLTDTLVSETDKYKEEKTRLQAQHSHLAAQLEESNEKLEKLSKEFFEEKKLLLEDKKSLEEQHKVTNQDLNTFHVKQEELEKSLLETRESLKIAEKNEKEMRESHEQLSSAKKVLEEESFQTKSIENNEIASLAKEIENLKEAQKNNTKDSEELLELSILELKEKHKTEQSNLERETKLELNALQEIHKNELTASGKEQEVLKNQLETTQENLKTIQEQHQSVQEELKTTQEQYKSVQEKHESVQDQLKIAQEQHDSAQEKLRTTQDLSQELQAMTEKHKETTTSLETKTQRVETQEKEVVSLTSSIKALEKKIADFENQHRETSTKAQHDEHAVQCAMKAISSALTLLDGTTPMGKESETEET